MINKKKKQRIETLWEGDDTIGSPSKSTACRDLDVCTEIGSRNPSLTLIPQSPLYLVCSSITAPIQKQILQYTLHLSAIFLLSDSNVHTTPKIMIQNVNLLEQYCRWHHANDCLSINPSYMQNSGCHGKGYDHNGRHLMDPVLHTVHSLSNHLRGT